MSLTVIGASLSPFVRKTHVFLAEKGVPFEVDPLVPFGVSEEYKQKSPLGKIPCLMDGERAIPDSSVICAYLEKVHPDPALYPTEPYEFARALWFEEYGDGALVNAGIATFQERVLKPKLMKQEGDEAKVEEAMTVTLPPFLTYLDAQLGDDDFLVGNRFGIADIAIASPFVNFAHGDCRVDPARWPRLAAHVDRVHSRPSFKACIETDKKFLGAVS